MSLTQLLAGGFLQFKKLVVRCSFKNISSGNKIEMPGDIFLKIHLSKC